METPESYYDLLEQGNYLGAVRLLESQRWEIESMRLQELAWLFDDVGRYRDAQQAFNQAMGEPWPPVSLSPEKLDALGQAPLEPAEDVILRAAVQHQLVIVNEMHHQVEHRAFGARLLPKLRAVGVSYLALETWGQAPLDEAMETGRVTRQTGSYCGEPQRAEFTRAIRRAGMKPIAIDFMTAEEAAERERDPSRSLAIRETAMARHIDELILQRDPAARVLIWAGGNHGAKRPWCGSEWMALRLWQRTGIEPFSVAQISDAGHLGHDHSIYRLMVKIAHRPVREPMAIQLPAAGFSAEFPDTLLQHPIYSDMIALGVDAVILHPPEPFETLAQRPAWLQPQDAAEIVGVVLQDEAPAEGFLVQALAETDDDECTPADQVVTDDWGRYQLRIRPGRYRLRIWAPAERIGDEHVVAVVPGIECRPHQTERRAVRLPGSP